MEIENLGIYQRNYRTTPKVDVDISDRDIWLSSIEYVSEKEMWGDIYETYRLYFQVNSGKGAGKQFFGDDWTLVLQVTMPTYYRLDEDVAKELVDSLKDYPIIDRNEVYNAFLYRRFYIPSDIKL